METAAQKSRCFRFSHVILSVWLLFYLRSVKIFGVRKNMGRFNFKDEQDFEEVKAKAEALYAAVDAVYCPYFGKEVVFNAKGWEHVKFKGRDRARSRHDQYVRFKLFPLAQEVLQKSHTVQGIWKTKKFEPHKTNSRWEHILKEIVFHEFIAVLENVRLKVVVKETREEERYFWSVIPFWKVDATNSKRVLHSGNPESD